MYLTLQLSSPINKNIKPNVKKGPLPEVYLSLQTAKDTPKTLTTPTNEDASGSLLHQRTRVQTMELLQPVEPRTYYLCIIIIDVILHYIIHALYK